MFRCSRVLGISLRWIQSHARRSDTLMGELRKCSDENQIFQVVELHKSRLAACHVNYALQALYEIQKDNTNVYLHEITNHPEFSTLHSLVENRLSHLNDLMLVNILLSLLRLKVKSNNSLVQRLVMEGWRRLERFNIFLLALFTSCLSTQKMHGSPLYGQIVDCVDRKLEDVKSLRVLTSLMFELQHVCSQRLQHRMLTKAEALIEVQDPLVLLDMGKILVFLKNMGGSKHVLWHKCAQCILQNIMHMNIKTFRMLDHFLPYFFEYPEVQVKVKSRLLELLESCSETRDFLFIFRMLFPMASQETRERLESKLLTLANSVQYTKLPNILKSMSVAKCKNPFLYNMVCYMIQKNVHRYKPQGLCMIAEALVSLPYQQHRLLEMVQMQIIQALKKPSETFETGLIVWMTCTASLSVNSVDEDILYKLNALVPQLDLRQTGQISTAVMKWIMKNPQQSSYKKLYQKLNKHAQERIRNTKNLDVLSKEIMILIKGHLLKSDYAEAIMDTCQRFQHQINSRNVSALCEVINQSSIRCIPVLDKIAEVVTENMKEFSAFEMHYIVRAFSFLNYEPPNGEEFYSSCIQHCENLLDSLPPHRLVSLAFALALAERFPKTWIKAIFNAHFLQNLDLVLNGSIPIKSSQAWIRHCLMQLNRAVCLECPEYEIPWFHDQYCQELQKTESTSENSIDYQFQQLLGAALGGPHYLRMSVVTPYYYSIDFECILDRNKKPVSYMDPTLLSTDISKMQPGSNTQKYIPLPRGLQRVAVDFLHPGNVCRDSSCINGFTAMKKRHLEILGYSVVQIPVQEWNSMELGTNDAWINYLKRKIFSEI